MKSDNLELQIISQLGEIQGEIKAVKTTVDGIDSRLGNLESTVQTIQSEFGNERVKHQKTQSESEAVSGEVERILEHMPQCETRFQALEQKTSGMSGKIIGIGLGITALISLLSFILSLVHLWHG